MIRVGRTTPDRVRRPRKARGRDPQNQQIRMVTVMTHSHFASAVDPIVEPMIALARCSKLQRIIVAGSKSVELASKLNRRGYVRVASTANSGRAAGQYDVVDWRRRTFKTLETTLDWLVNFLGPEGLLAIWIDPQKPAVREDLYSRLEQRGFVIEDRAIHEYGSAFRRGDAK
jgi:hypothetical protein